MNDELTSDIFKEAFVTFVRQIMLVYGTYLTTTGLLDESLLQPILGLTVAGTSIGWMIFARFIYPKIKLYIVTKDHNDEPVVIQTTTKEVSVKDAKKLV
jgi:hypothetical protein